MNVYDFDHTIYDGDSTVDFYLYCVKKHPQVLLALPFQAAAVLMYLLKKYDKTRMKQGFYRFLKWIPADEAFLGRFWQKHITKIQPWYLQQKQVEDVVISASPEFLLRPVCNELGIRLIASGVEQSSGRCTTPNCHDKEKVQRFRAEYPKEEITAFYSDSLSDQPMAAISCKAFLVKGQMISPWPNNSKQELL